MENLQTRSEPLRVAEDRVRESQPDFKADQLRINISWHETESIGEAHGRQSRQYLEKVLSVLSEELAYFSFIAGIYHCGTGDRSSRERVIRRLNGKIQDSLSLIKSVEDRLKGAADNCSARAVEAAVAAPSESKFPPTKSGIAGQNPAAEIADIEAKLEELKWERGPVFFNLSCIGIIDGHHEGRIEGLEEARAAKSSLESRLKGLKRPERNG